MNKSFNKIAVPSAFSDNGGKMFQRILSGADNGYLLFSSSPYSVWQTGQTDKKNTYVNIWFSDRKWNPIQLSLGHAHTTKTTANKIKTQINVAGRLVKKNHAVANGGHGSSKGAIFGHFWEAWQLKVSEWMAGFYYVLYFFFIKSYTYFGQPQPQPQPQHQPSFVSYFMSCFFVVQP